jgi:hypothetical protein
MTPAYGLIHIRPADGHLALFFTGNQGPRKDSRCAITASPAQGRLLLNGIRESSES